MGSRYLLAMSAAQLKERLSRDREGLIAEMAKRAARGFNTSVEAGERTSWRGSIPAVVDLLIQAGLGEIITVLEMSNLSSDRRVDMVLVGSHPADGELSVVLIENKQWQWARMNRATGRVIHPGGYADVQHPVQQIWAYGESMRRHMSLLNSAHMYHVVNLHNAERAAVEKILPPVEPLPEECDDSVRVFTGDASGRSDFVSFLSTVLSADRASEHLRDINEARVTPNEDLMRAVDRTVRARSIFVLLDEQQDAVNQVIRAVREAGSASNKHVFIIRGGPGTGKSVLALELLGKLNRLGYQAVHASGSTAFAGALRKHLTGPRRKVEDTFTYFNQHGRRDRNELHALIIDEAHRLRPTSSNFRTKPEDRTNVPQAYELIEAARVPVFLLDPYQVIRAEEVGTIEAIRQAAHDCGVLPENVHEIMLGSQFRHSRCPEYIDWVEQLFGQHGGPPVPWNQNEDFEVLLAQSPHGMEDYLRARTAMGHTARITAGYCWKWPVESAETDRMGNLINSVVIDDWRRPWNARREYSRKRIPGPASWATYDTGFEQIGCVYTAQSFEWDYAGLIIGTDFTWRNSRWMATKNKDRATSNVAQDRLHEVIRNTYRTLATRGLHGIVLYAVDHETQRMLTDLGIPDVQNKLQQVLSSSEYLRLRSSPHVDLRLPQPTEGQIF
ncbi:DUF2075 domain-containing protein [Sphaerisporangium sp. NBC_01403]|uniref:DUF2075 domain-containing protein n=1 Tax=Sphaerisporangium sp. NBC_01403 TaxID=2903599 RepID=UPI0032467A59